MWLRALGLALVGGSLAAQVPPEPLPPSVAPIEAKTPLPENLAPVDPRLFTARKLNGSWSVYQGTTVFCDFSQDADGAHDAHRALRELLPTEWARVGTGRTVVEYGLTNGKPTLAPSAPRNYFVIDLKTVRVEPVRGAWCLRDDENLLLNFGVQKNDAEQAVAVVRKYGFNRIGVVGKAGTFSYFYAQPDGNAGKPSTASAKDLAITKAIQEQSMTRTGIEVTGVGFVGEKLAIDARKVEFRKEKGEWVIAAGPEILARFGGSESAAREAAKVVQECRFTEFGRYGTGGAMFFLVNGKAPTNVPFFAHGARFDPNGLKVRELAGKWWVYDAGGKSLFAASSVEEGEILIKLIKAYGFDQLCQVGTSPRSSLRFLAKAK